MVRKKTSALTSPSKGLRMLVTHCANLQHQEAVKM